MDEQTRTMLLGDPITAEVINSLRPTTPCGEEHAARLRVTRDGVRRTLVAGYTDTALLDEGALCRRVIEYVQSLSDEAWAQFPGRNEPLIFHAPPT